MTLFRHIFITTDDRTEVARLVRGGWMVWEMWRRQDGRLHWDLYREEES